MTTQAGIRVLTVDDHAVFRQGIATVFGYQDDMTLVAEAACGGEALRQFHTHKPDVTLMDLRLPDMSGIHAMIEILKRASTARVIILSTFAGDAEVQRALQFGAWGYVLKTMDPVELVNVVRQVHAGTKSIPSSLAICLAEHLAEERLSVREVEVLERVASGRRNREIGQDLFISEDTVKRHMKQILQKLDAADRTHAIAIAARRGIIQL